MNSPVMTVAPSTRLVELVELVDNLQQGPRVLLLKLQKQTDSIY
jgi:hypothetical protein